jgi:hypothetical protein
VWYGSQAIGPWVYNAIGTYTMSSLILDLNLVCLEAA